VSRRLPLLLGALAATLAAPAGAGEPFAVQLDAENVLARRVGGPQAIGGIGDWALGNGTICAVLSDPAHGTDITATGGYLVDLGRCGRADDRMTSLLSLVNVERENVPVVESVRAERTGDEARLVTVARWEGLEIRTVYAAAAAEPDVLRIDSEVARVAPEGRFVVLGQLVVHPNATLRAFTVDTASPALSPGFEHGPEPGESLRSIASGLRRADVQVLVGAGSDSGGDPGIAYALRLVSAHREHAGGGRAALPHVGLNGMSFSLLGVFSRGFWLGGGERLGLLELVQAPAMDLADGDRLRVAHRIHVGARGDVASALDAVWAEGPRVAGRVDDAAARLHVSREGAPVTQVRPEADGRFAFHVPGPGRYEIHATAPGHRTVHVPLVVEADGADVGTVSTGAPGRLALPRGHAMRLVFRGLDGTPDPRFGDDRLGLRFGDALARPSTLGRDVSLAGVASDPASVALAPGRYRVLATRGPEFTVEEAAVRIRAGRTTPLVIGIPARAVETPGWIAADLHVHAAGSFDSTVPLADRVRSFVAQGGEVLVSTEHDHVVDYGPVIEGLGLAGALAWLPGVEVTGILRSDAAPRTAGHANALPMPLRPRLHRGGALPSQGVRLRTPIAALRALGGERLFQLNHPRVVGEAPEDEALLTHLSFGRPFDPTRPVNAPPNRSLVERAPETGVRDVDFDAMELLNGPNGPDNEVYRRARADWLSLALQGLRRTGTANSDSHTLARPVALPRSQVRLADDRPARLDTDAFVRAVRAGRLVGTTGPFLEVDLAGAGPGETAATDGAELSVTVRAAPWVPVGHVRVYVDGAPAAVVAVSPGETVRVPLAFGRDALVTVETEGDASGPAGEVYRTVAPGCVPFAFANPVLVDADGDGRWTPPGLPQAPPVPLAAPLSP